MKSEIVPPNRRTRETLERPKARFFGFVSLMWCLVSSVPIFSMVLEPSEVGYSPGLNRTLWLLLMPHPVFIALAIYFRLTESPRLISKSTEEEFPVIH